MHTLSGLGRLIVLSGLLLNTPFLFAQEHPADHWEIGMEMGYLTKIRHNSPLHYEIMPTQLVWRTPVALELWRGADGGRLVLRNRLAIVFETFIEGPEDYYLGFAGSPVLELWTADKKTALFYELGGGSGLTNSKNVPGGQGQNFAFNWFTQLGLRHQISNNMALSGGTYFVHHSNLGMTKPNPGIDVLGLNFGIIWQFN